MAKSTSRSEDVKTPLAIVSYANNLFELRENEKGKKSYGCSLHFKKGTDISALKKAAVEAAVAQWGDKAKQLIVDEIIKSPFLDGDSKQGKTKEGVVKAGHPGTTFIRCQSGMDHKPKVFDRRRNPILDKDDCRSGSQVYGVVNAFTWENDEQGKGISFGVSIVQVVKNAEGDEILGGGGGPDPDKWLEKIDDEGTVGDTGGKGAESLFG